MVAVDRTEAFRDAVRRASGQGAGVSEELRARAEEGLGRARERGPRSPFLAAAGEVGGALALGWAGVEARRRDYLEQGRVPEDERDRIEAEAVLLLEAAREGIAGLEALAAGGGGSAHQAACRHGVALILSERLQGVAALFDSWRGIRFK